MYRWISTVFCSNHSMDSIPPSKCKKTASCTSCRLFRLWALSIQMPFKEFTFFPVAAIGRFQTDIAVKHMAQHMIPVSISL